MMALRGFARKMVVFAAGLVLAAISLWAVFVFQLYMADRRAQEVKVHASPTIECRQITAEIVLRKLEKTKPPGGAELKRLQDTADAHGCDSQR